MKMPPALLPEAQILKIWTNGANMVDKIIEHTVGLTKQYKVDSVEFDELTTIIALLLTFKLGYREGSYVRAV